MLTFEAKCEVLHHLIAEYADEYEFIGFMELYDVGVHCSYLFIQNHVILTDSGRECVEEAWQALCDQLEIDSYGDYNGLDAMIGLSQSES